MTVAEQFKIIDNNIETNLAQYDLQRLAAIICAKSSNELAKYEYLTGEDLEYKPSAVKQAKLDYSLLGKVLTRG